MSYGLVSKQRVAPAEFVAPPPSDAELIEGCRSGDADAWDTLVARYERLVFSVARRNGLERDDAADVTQVTFIALLDSLAALRADERLSSWLMTVARRQAWRVLRRRQVELPVATMTEVVDPLADWDRVACVHDALRRLPRPCRDLLHALYFDPTEPSYAEVAAQLGRSIGGIGPMRARCLQRMRVLLDEDTPQ